MVFFWKTDGVGGGGGPRWTQPINDNSFFDSPVNIIEKKKKAAKIQRLTNSEQHSTPTL